MFPWLTYKTLSQKYIYKHTHTQVHARAMVVVGGDEGFGSDAG